ncbi:MAG: hypothetical protein PSN34_00370 [Urechidicola sp.]|nr:hypothetical protein [Urechidicola sp.]
MKTKFILILSFLFLILISCSEKENEECIDNSIALITSVNAPSVGVVNEIINIEVKFQVRNGCGKFGRFIETGNINVKTIEVEAEYIGCFCTHDLPTRHVNYEFIPTSVGNYELIFKSSETNSIVINISIN